MAGSRKAIPIDAEIDLKDPEIYASGVFHRLLAKLRTEEPIYWNPEADSTGFWAITRYDDILRVIQDPVTFSADIKNGGMRIYNKQDVHSDPKPQLLAMDPPQHTQLRHTLQPLFTPAAVAAVEGRIRHRLSRLIDGIAPAGKAEFVTSVAAPLTLGFLTDLLGVPESDGPLLFKWTNTIICDDDPDCQSGLGVRLQALEEMDAYAARLLAERRASPGHDFVSMIAAARIDGEPLDFGTYSENFLVFLVGGNETTRHTLSAGILALSLFPKQKERLLADRSLIASAVKEITRWATPIMHVRRTAMKDVEVGGRLIRKGDKVVVWYNSANRDEAKWPDAAEFDVGRFIDKGATPHIAFSAGPHYCLGKRAAELQIQLTLEELLNRLPDFRVTEPARILRSNFISGVKELNIAFTPEPAKA